MSSKDWTWDDYEFLYRNYGVLSVEEIAQKLNRSVSSVISHADKLGLLPISDFNKKDIIMARNYHKQLGTALIFLLPMYSTTKIQELIACSAEGSK